MSMFNNDMFSINYDERFYTSLFLVHHQQPKDVNVSVHFWEAALDKILLEGPSGSKLTSKGLLKMNMKIYICLSSKF